MVKTETLIVDLPVEVMAKVRGAVEDGEYGSDNEVVSDALLVWASRRGNETEDVEWLRQAWQESIDDGAPYVPMEEVMDRLEAKYKAIAAERAKV
jgi:antitoxin ParD1/3/4